MKTLNYKKYCKLKKEIWIWSTERSQKYLQSRNKNEKSNITLPTCNFQGKQSYGCELHSTFFGKHKSFNGGTDDSIYNKINEKFGFIEWTVKYYDFLNQISFTSRAEIWLCKSNNIQLNHESNYSELLFEYRDI
jgi:hypothetical protein